MRARDAVAAAALLGVLAAGAGALTTGCSWLIGVSGDPYVPDEGGFGEGGFGGGADASDEAETGSSEAGDPFADAAAE